MAVDVVGPELPRGLRRHAVGVHYVERIAPRDRDIADQELSRLVLRIQGGERDLFDELYRRAFSDVLGYFRVVLGDDSDAEDASQQVFLSALAAIDRFQLRRGTPFRAWLFRIARHEALGQLNRRRRQTVTEDDVLDRQRELLGCVADDRAADWVSDPELLAFIERLSLPQRQVLALRYMLGMRTPEIAAVLDKTEQAVRHLESRALRFLQQRLTAVGRGPSRQARAAMVMRERLFPVLRERRMALAAVLPAQWVRGSRWR
jgi:RNA polymerase sigma-70 factor (ECF subfamily)